MEANITKTELPETADPLKAEDGTAAVLAKTEIEPPAAHAEERDDFDDEIRSAKRKRRLKISITIIVLLLAAAAALYFVLGRSAPAAEASSKFTFHTVGLRDITSSLSGSGTLQPADSYSVTALVSGEILLADFEEGDIVSKDTVLYQIDSSDTRTSIEQAENSLEQTRRNYNQRAQSLADLQIKASGTGTIVNMNVEVGDKVSAGQLVATIRNSAVMTLTVPFGIDDADRLAVGQTAEVVLDSTFERISGVVSKISPFEEVLAGNMIVRMVTIDVANPGGLSLSHVAAASVNGVYSNGSGSFDYKEEKTVTAAASGDVAAINAKEGDFVQKDSVLVQLRSDSLSNDVASSANTLRNEELSLQNRYKQLDNYTITSPISGTIIDKVFKEGDKMETGKLLCIIFDLSYLTMTLNVDELDIADVNVGQEVTVTAEALGDKAFTGVVTRININGTTVNGVTSYPVTIRLDETEGLLPGMNVQAEIIVSHSAEVVAIPVSALSRGNRVLVKTDGNPTQFVGREIPAQAGEGSGQRFSGGGQPQVSGGGPVQIPNDGTARPFVVGPQDGSSQTGAPTTGLDGLPEGFQYVVVTTGASDGDYIEITSGLSEGDEIAYITDTPGQDMFMPGMVVGYGPGAGMGPQSSSGAVPAGGTTVVRRPID